MEDYTEDASSFYSRLTAYSPLPETVTQQLIFYTQKSNLQTIYSLLSLPMETLGVVSLAS